MQVVQEFCEKSVSKLHDGENDEHLQATKYISSTVQANILNTP